MCLILLFFLGSGNVIAAEPPSNAELYQLILQLKDENQRLKEQLAALSGKMETNDKGIGQPTVAEMQPDRAETDKALSVEAGIDLLFLDFYAAQGADGDDSNYSPYFPDMGTHLTPRYWVEVQHNKKIGLRARYLNYDHTRFYLGLDRNVSFELFDLELTVPVALGQDTEIKPFIGYRYGDIGLDGSDFGEPNPYQFTGHGLTVGMDLKHALWGSDFSLTAGGRYSLLYGKTEFEPVTDSSLDDTIVSGFELFMGVEYLHDFGNIELGIEAGWEQQYYGTDTYFPFAIDPETIGDVSLGGPIVSVEVKY